MRRLAIAVGCSSALILGCGGATPAPAADDPLTPARLYPLAEGNAWSYDVEGAEDSFDAETGEALPALAVTRVTSVAGSRVAVSTNGSDEVVYELRDEGIFVAADRVWLLRTPIEVGAEWPSRSGRTARITDVAVSIESPAGTFAGCVEIAEDGGDPPLRIRTVYCPDVGPVGIDSTLPLPEGETEVRVSARLRGFDLAPTSNPDAAASETTSER